MTQVRRRRIFAMGNLYLAHRGARRLSKNMYIKRSTVPDLARSTRRRVTQLPEGRNSWRPMRAFPFREFPRPSRVRLHVEKYHIPRDERRASGGTNEITRRFIR